MFVITKSKFHEDYPQPGPYSVLAIKRSFKILAGGGEIQRGRAWSVARIAVFTNVNPGRHTAITIDA